MLGPHVDVLHNRLMPSTWALQAHGGNAGIFPFNVNKWMVVIPGALGGICFVIGTLLAWVVTHRSISLMRADPSKPTSLCAILYLFVSTRNPSWPLLRTHRRIDFFMPALQPCNTLLLQQSEAFASKAYHRMRFHVFTNSCVGDAQI